MSGQQLIEMIGPGRYNRLVGLAKSSMLYGIMLDTMSRDDLFAVIGFLHECQQVTHGHLQDMYNLLEVPE